MDDAMKRLTFDVTVWTVSLVLGLGLIAYQAAAGSGSVSARNERWQAECGSCHIAYPPKFLSAPAWRRLMAGLDRHFGTDASLDAKTAADIGAFLESEAGTGRRALDPAQTIRITETAWFLHQHDEIPAATWKKPAVKGPGNCAACHTAAAQGDFRESNVRIPR